MSYLQIPQLTNPLVSPWDQFVASGAASGGVDPLGYLGIANMLLNPPQGLQDATQIGAQGQPMVNQAQPWGMPAASGAMQGAMAGMPFGWPGAAVGAGAGMMGGKK